MEVVIQSLFPTGTVTGSLEEGFEVTNLPDGCTPINCDLLATTAWGHDEREFHLVESGDYGIYLRICNAEIGSGYDKFVTIHTILSKQDPEYDAFIQDKMTGIALALSLSQEELIELRIMHRSPKLGKMNALIG